MRGEIAATKDGKILAIRTNVLADHGAFNGTAAPVKYPAGFFGVFTGSYDLEAAYCKMTAVYTNKAPGGVAYACSFRITEAVYLVERIVDCLAYELKMDPVELRLQELHPARAVPVHDQDRLGLRLGQLRGHACARRCAWPATTNCAREQADKRGTRRADGHRLSRSSPRRSAPGRARTWTSSVSAWPTGASCACTPPARRWCACRAEPGAGARDDVRADRRRGDRHPARGHPGRQRRHRSDTRSAWAPTAAARRRCRARPPRWWRARSATRRRSSPRACSRSRWPTWNGRRARSTSRATRPSR